MKKESKKQIKKKIIILIMFLIMLLICLVTFNKNLEDVYQNDGDQNSGKDNSKEVNNIYENISGEVYKELNVKKRVGDIEISNVRIELLEKDKCRFTASVKNVSDKFLTPTNLSVKVINQNGETEALFGGIVTELIREEENIFVTYVYADITDAYDVEFEIIDM